MGKFLILLILGLAAAEKLNRIYLPPPGAIFSGGNPEELQIPFEFPKASSEVPFKITAIDEEKELLPHEHYAENTDGASIKKIVDITSRSKSPQTSFLNTATMKSLSYISPTFSQENVYDATTKLYNTKQEDINASGVKQGDPKLNYSVSYTDNRDTSTRISLDTVPVYQYPVHHVPYIDTMLASQTLITQNQGNNKYSQNNTSANSRDTTIPLTENSQKDYIPNNYQFNRPIQTAKYTSNAKIVDNSYNTHTNTEYNKLYSIIPTSNTKSRYGTEGTTSFPSSIKSRPLSPVSVNKIVTSRRDPNPPRPQAQADINATLLYYHNIVTPNGYSYAYNTSNGLSAKENGTAINGVRARGDFSYTGDDGKVYKVVYTADENGFLPRGDHLPVVPLAIQQVIEKSAKDKELGIFNDGSYDEAKYGHKNYQGIMDLYNPEFQGFTGNDLKFSEKTINQIGGEDIRKKTKTVPVSIENKLNGNNNGKINPGSPKSAQEDNRKDLSSNQRRVNNNQLNNSFTRTLERKKYTGDITDSKREYILSDEQQYKNRLSNQEFTKIPFQTEEKEELQSQYKNLATIRSEDKQHLRQTLRSNKNIPEILENPNAYSIDNNQAILANKGDGYYYVTPHNKFIENGDQIINTERDPFNTDQELEIGDDDIVAISVASPNTFTSPNKEMVQPTIPYPNVYSVERIPPAQNNANQDIDYPEMPNMYSYNVASASMLPDINIHQNRGLDDGSQSEHGIPIIPTESSNIGLKTAVQTDQGHSTPNVVVDGFGKQIIEFKPTYSHNFGMIPQVYGHKTKTISLNLESYTDNGITDKDSLKKSEESVVSHVEDSQRLYLETLISDRNTDRTSISPAKTNIGEAFRGPKRPQSFDPQTGYYY